MRVRVLGPVDALDDTGAPVAIGSRNQRLVLAVLAAHAGHTVSADRLVDALWGDEPPRTASGTLRTYVSRLRHVLGNAVALRPGGYALTLPPSEVDSEQFERLVQEVGEQAPGARIELLERALALWRGPAFGDVGDEEVLRGATVRLEELRTRPARPGLGRSWAPDARGKRRRRPKSWWLSIPCEKGRGQSSSRR